MADVQGIHVELTTHSEEHSGTDDNIYVGLGGSDGGREFPLASRDEDFKAGKTQNFLLGDVPRVLESLPGAVWSNNSKLGEENDPSGLSVEIESFQTAYIRKGFRSASDDDAYQLSEIRVNLYGQSDTPVRGFLLVPRGGLWLGNEYGHVAWLKPFR